MHVENKNFSYYHTEITKCKYAISLKNNNDKYKKLNCKLNGTNNDKYKKLNCKLNGTLVNQ